MKSLKATILTEMKAAILDIGLCDGEDLGQAVHSFRRRCKRIRAYLRLLPTPHARRVRCVREQVRLAALSLSELRDAQVMAITWRRMLERLRESGNQAIRGTLSEMSASIHQPRAERTECTATHDPLQVAEKCLTKAKRMVTRLPNWQCKAKLFIHLRRTYRAVRHATQVAANRASPEDFHELRKTTKQFYHQCQYVVSAYHRNLQTEIDAARTLADRLGDALDLSVLSKNLTIAAQNGDSSIHSEMIDESQQQMAMLFNESALLACRLFFESPKEFSRRIE